jgi:LAO/AO transport system kinase
LIRHLRRDHERIAVLAIDPSSPFTGGAILGDRVRMQDHATDAGVFIRSMATRGHLGGLALATPEAVRLLASVGWQLIVIETVGVGQVEVEVAGKADTTIVVVNPGWGDSVQASKAGLLEVADVFVINKADRPGVEQTRLDLDQMLDLAAPDSWRPPIVSTVATDGTGIADVWAAVGDHRYAATESGLLARRRAARSREELGEVVARQLQQRARELCGEERWRQLTDAVVAGELDPWAAADEMIEPAIRRP